jgi:hypothetical protein
MAWWSDILINHLISCQPAFPHSFKLKTILNKKRLQDTDSIIKNVTATLNSLPFSAFSDCFLQNLERCKYCVAENGEWKNIKHVILISCITVLTTISPELYFWPHMHIHILNLSNESSCMVNFMIKILCIYKKPQYPLSIKPGGLLIRPEQWIRQKSPPLPGCEQQLFMSCSP